MEHIKCAPETDDSEDIRVEAEALVAVSDNPGIKDAVFAALARAIVCTFPHPDYSYAQQRGKLERMALRYQVGVATEKILKGIELSDMKNHVDAKKIEIACREALKNWPKDLEKSPVTIRSQAYKILTSRKVHMVIEMPEYAMQDIDDKAARPWNDK